MVRESNIEKYLVRRVKEIGGEVRKCRWIGRTNAPDRRLMFLWDLSPGVVRSPCWVELKATGEKPTMAQYREHKRMRDLGERVYVVNSLEQVDKLLECGYV